MDLNPFDLPIYVLNRVINFKMDYSKFLVMEKVLIIFSH